MGYKSKQIPGTIHTFEYARGSDTVLLPSKLGQSNEQVYWSKNRRPQGGSWKSRKLELLRQANIRKERGVVPRKKQIPGTEHTFFSTLVGSDTGILPSAYGQSNDFAMWRSSSSSESGGSWRSRKIHTDRHQKNNKGLGKDGILGRMRILLTASRCRDVRQGYLPIGGNADDLLTLWVSQHGICSACGGSIKLLEAHLDHDHETGIPRGFIHRHCNITEGCVSKMTDSEFEHWVNWERNKRHK